MDKERNYRWAKKIAKHSYKNNFIKNDDQGNVFVRNDAGIYKYDSSGNLLWSKEGRFTDICTDPVGNIYLSGSYYKYLMYDTDTLKVSNGTDGFVFKLNPNGGLLWTICTSLDTYHLGAAYSLALDT